MSDSQSKKEAPMAAAKKKDAVPKASVKVPVNPAVAIAAELKESLPTHVSRPVVEEIGQVVYIGDGVCKVRGLPSVRIEDVIEVETPVSIVPALVLGITEDLIEAVVLGDYTPIRQGQVARSTGDVLQVPVGEALLGRVVTPLGEPLDGRGPIVTPHRGEVEKIAPGVAKRAPVEEQFESGILVVDAMIPLGKGQRELVIGDRKSGKTRLMTNFIVNQKGKGIYCFYVAVGAQKAKIRALEESLRLAGAMDYTTIIMGSSDDTPSLNYIAPYVGTAMAEYFEYKGHDAIIIYDDLSRHAKAYRQMSLLLKRSPGRDAYPGDIFYLHSRLLERSAKLHEKLGAGSLTGFPMAETLNGDNSEYIVTNLMSITDGHIYLDVNLMHEGVLPAVNSGASVSRIGGGVQPPALRKLGELSGSQMARYNEVKSFEALNTEVNEETEREIKRGKRLLNIFGQDSALCLNNAEKTLLLHLVTSGKCDNVELGDLTLIRTSIIPFYREQLPNKPRYQEYASKAEKEKIDDLDPYIWEIVADFLKTRNDIYSANSIIQEAMPTPQPMPIVPDPKSVGVDAKKDEKK